MEILDGAMGTLLKANGIEGCLELANLDFPEIVEKIHRNYIEAGADYITANTFNCTVEALKERKNEQYKCVVKGVEIAKRIAKKYGKKVVGTFCLPEKMQALALLDSKPDFIMIETIFDLKKGKESLELLLDLMKNREEKIPIMLSFTVKRDASLYSGERLIDILDIFLNENIYSIGINCSEYSEEIYDFYKKISKLKIKKTYHPNILMGEKEVLAGMKKLAKESLVDILGGCCGTDFKFIQKIKKWRI